MKDFVAVRLGHAGMDVKTGIAELSDLLGQELNTLDRVTEYNALVDLQLERERGREGEGRREREGGGGGRGERERESNVVILCDSTVLGLLTLEKRVLRQWTFCLSST